MIRILQKHYARYKYVKYGLSLVNLSQFGFKKKWAENIFVIMKDLKSCCDGENGQDGKK